tara:strand:- start:2753 stop:3661 length:909 start_codon:yes stop_codon:yes gene_type:complete
MNFNYIFHTRNKGNTILAKLLENDIKTKEVLNWEGLNLFDFQASSCCQKTRIVLNLKGIPWKKHSINLIKAENYSKWYLGINPRGLVPTLVHNGTVLIESNNIITYLDEKFPEPSLIPKKYREGILQQLKLEDDLHMDLRTLTMRFVLPDFLTKKPSVALERSEKYNGTVGGIVDTKSKINTEFWRLHAICGITPEQVKEAVHKFQKTFKSLDESLKMNHFIMGDKLTLADIGWFIYAHRLIAIGYPIKQLHPHVYKWYEKLVLKSEFSKEIKDPIPLYIMRNLYNFFLKIRGKRLSDIAQI